MLDSDDEAELVGGDEHVGASSRSASGASASSSRTRFDVAALAGTDNSPGGTWSRSGRQLGVGPGAIAVQYFGAVGGLGDTVWMVWPTTPSSTDSGGRPRRSVTVS